jgi:hypothetical protein
MAPCHRCARCFVALLRGHLWAIGGGTTYPDCLLLGKTTKLTDLEVASAASIVAMTCGMLLLYQDDSPKVPMERMRIASKIYPMTGATATVLDLHSTNDGMPSLLRLWCTDLLPTRLFAMKIYP